MPSRKNRLLLISFLVPSIVLIGGLSALNARPAAESPQTEAAARLNSLGVALMNQQLTEKAAAKFAEAHAADPGAAIPVLNRGIALLYLEKLPEADQELRQAAAIAPDNPRTWYNLGLTEMDEANPKQAIEEMRKVLAIDPNDADAHYFVGSLDVTLGDLNGGIAEFETALKLNPLHCSAEFGLARALQRAGRTDEAHDHLKVFQHETQAKLASPLSVGYGERGHYSTMEEMALEPEPVGAMIPVKFEAKQLSGADEGGVVVDWVGPGAGACVIDIEGPGSQDMVTFGPGKNTIWAYRNLHNGSFEPIPSSQTGLNAEGAGRACAVGDFDNDGLPDLAIAMQHRVILYRNLGGGKFEDVTAKVGITQGNWAKGFPMGLTFVDFDHDGDLDLYVTGAGPSVMWRNNGNSTFTEWTGPTGLAGPTGQGLTVQPILSDINNDRAVDLVVTGAQGAPTIYFNQREGAFRPMPLYTDANLPATRGVAVFDFNKDGWMDVAVTHAGAPGLTLWRNVDGKHFERVALPLPAGVTGGWGVTPIDVDNDGWIDLAAVLEVGGRTELHVFRNLGAKSGSQGFEDVTAELGLDKVALHGAGSVIAADVDGDGAADLIVTQAARPPVVLRNVGGNAHHSLRIALTGLADNKTAIGTKVEVLAGGMWQKFEVAGGGGYLSQGSSEIVAGLGKADHVDVVRLLWPTGVPQDEIDIHPGKELALKELDRRGSSCPVLFAWDGKKYQFISDVIGAAVIGHWVSPTATNQNDPDEWIKVDGDKLRARNGLLSLRFGEPMEEVNSIDQLRLVAVDHPAGTEVYPDERFLSEKPFASGTTVAVSAPRPVAGAWDNDGRDVRELLAADDHRYVRDFTNLSYAGFANLHTLTLDIGAWSPERPVRLLLDGYIEYFSASSMYAAWQAGLHPIPPGVDVQMPDGSWKRVIQDMGFPAGLPRTIVVDLTGKLPAGARKIRITTNLQIYWDRARVDNGPDVAGQVRSTEVPLAMAHLAFRGYPQQIEGKTPGDLTYNYDRISATGPFLWARGVYTRYGDVTPLLRSVDDRYVIFGTGEEIDAEFSAHALPPLPSGWTRDYFFYANGFVKDMDYWEASPFTVGPMPFHAMSRYPYPATEHYPQGAGADAYWLDWNSRFESGNRRQKWDFDYEPARETPVQ
ncbi:MAG TPA: FG-GAP-like repeat-containing protein [Acidobacteriaceae bacterium]|jgi:tetratricopeptide (TPR) repeat protein|nr:FG-GAP-like repeat-containing protein [Acidobacteriaceae bacterium]